MARDMMLRMVVYVLGVAASMGIVALFASGVTAATQLAAGGIVGAVFAIFAYRRASRLGRNKWGWAAICFLTGIFGMAALWLVSKGEVGEAPEEEEQRDQPTCAHETTESGTQCLKCGQVLCVEPIGVIEGVSVWSDTGASPRFLTKSNSVRLRVTDEIEGHYQVELPDGTVGYVWADDVTIRFVQADSR